MVAAKWARFGLTGLSSMRLRPCLPFIPFPFDRRRHQGAAWQRAGRWLVSPARQLTSAHNAPLATTSPLARRPGFAWSRPALTRAGAAACPHEPPGRAMQVKLSSSAPVAVYKLQRPACSAQSCVHDSGYRPLGPFLNLLESAHTRTPHMCASVRCMRHLIRACVPPSLAACRLSTEWCAFAGHLLQLRRAARPTAMVGRKQFHFQRPMSCGK